jgi:hypothetical protein
LEEESATCVYLVKPLELWSLAGLVQVHGRVLFVIILPSLGGLWSRTAEMIVIIIHIRDGWTVLVMSGPLCYVWITRRDPGNHPSCLLLGLDLETPVVNLLLCPSGSYSSASDGSRQHNDTFLTAMPSEPAATAGSYSHPSAQLPPASWISDWERVL